MITADQIVMHGIGDPSLTAWLVIFAVWLLIFADNILHVVINGAAMRWL